MLARLTAYAFAAVAGVVAGVLGSFAQGYTTDGLPTGLLAGLGLLGAVLVTAGTLTRSRGGVLVAGGGWLLTVLLLAAPRPEGDLIVPGTGLGYAWLLGGMVVVGLLAIGSYGGAPRRAEPPSGDCRQSR